MEDVDGLVSIAAALTIEALVNASDEVNSIEELEDEVACAIEVEVGIAVTNAVEPISREPAVDVVSIMATDEDEYNEVSLFANIKLKAGKALTVAK